MISIPHIQKGETGSLSFAEKNNSYSRSIFFLYAIFIAIEMGIIFIRLFQLTVVRGKYFSSLADQNRVKEVIIEAPRGTITDRKGKILASNSKPDMYSKNLRIESTRTYYQSDAISHVVGYRQTADENDLENDPCVNKLILGDKTGKKGIEQLLECDLRGEHGKKLIEVDAHGAYKKTLSVFQPKHGENIKLAMDLTLQETAYDALGKEKGAVVAIKAGTGEILTLVSKPGYSAQEFEDGSGEEVEKIIKNPDKPLFNRATEGTYPPGSIYKLIVAAAGLEEGAMTADETILDKGVLEAGSLKFHNWFFLEYGKTDGEVDIVKALQRSNDIYFYTLGAKLGPEKIRFWSELFGLQKASGIGLHEAVGIVPSSFWKEDVLKEQWYLGDTYNLSIGQGYVAVTPLQLARVTSVFANNRKLCSSTLIKKDGSAGESDCEKVPISQGTYAKIREGMKAACEVGGTGYPFFDFSVNQPISSAQLKKDIENGLRDQYEATSSAMIRRKISVGCKTGTAESHGDERNPHSWFTVFAPFDNPEIVVTVLVEEGGQGSDVAAPIAKKVLTEHFERYE